MMIVITGWIGTLMILLGYYLNAKKKTSSWYVWFIGNMFMFIYSMGIQAFPQVALAVVLMGLNIYGYIQWKNK